MKSKTHSKLNWKYEGNTYTSVDFKWFILNCLKPNGKNWLKNHLKDEFNLSVDVEYFNHLTDLLIEKDTRFYPIIYVPSEDKCYYIKDIYRAYDRKMLMESMCVLKCYDPYIHKSKYIESSKCNIVLQIHENEENKYCSQCFWFGINNNKIAHCSLSGLDLPNTECICNHFKPKFSDKKNDELEDVINDDTELENKDINHDNSMTIIINNLTKKQELAIEYMCDCLSDPTLKNNYIGLFKDEDFNPSFTTNEPKDKWPIFIVNKELKHQITIDDKKNSSPKPCVLIDTKFPGLKNRNFIEFKGGAYIPTEFINFKLSLIDKFEKIFTFEKLEEKIGYKIDKDWYDNKFLSKDIYGNQRVLMASPYEENICECYNIRTTPHGYEGYIRDAEIEDSKFEWHSISKFTILIKVLTYSDTHNSRFKKENNFSSSVKNCFNCKYRHFIPEKNIYKCDMMIDERVYEFNICDQFVLKENYKK